MKLKNSGTAHLLKWVQAFSSFLKDNFFPKKELDGPSIDSTFLGDAGPLPLSLPKQGLDFWTSKEKKVVLLRLHQSPMPFYAYLKQVDVNEDKLVLYSVVVKDQSGPKTIVRLVGSALHVYRSSCCFISCLDAEVLV